MTSPPRTGPDDAGREDVPVLVLPVMCAAILLDALDLSITQVALPQIQAALDIGAARASWVVNAYVLCYGGLLLLGGRLADRYGAKTLFVAGMVLFGAGSLGGGVAMSGELLIAARALQGIGAALTVPAAVATLAANFEEGPSRDRAFGVFAAFASAGFSIGLVLGGVLGDTVGWRWIFLVKVPMVVLVVAAAWRAVPPDGRRRRAALGVVPALAATGALVLLAFVITVVGERGLSAIVLIAAVLTATLAVVFVLAERRATAPLLPRALLRNRPALAAQMTSLTVLATPFAYAYLLTHYLAEVGGYTPLQIGLALLPGAAASAAVSRLGAPWLLDRLGSRLAGAASLVVIAAGLGVLLLAGPEPSYVLVILPSTIVTLGIGMGLAYPVFNLAALGGVDEQEQGAAAGLQNTALQIGGGLGLALVSTVAASRLDTAASSQGWVDALHVGALAAAAMPLLGALMFLALTPTRSTEHSVPSNKENA